MGEADEQFEIRETHDPDGAVRLRLRGELDLAVADRLRAGLTELARGRAIVRLDLSELTFLDSSGIRVLVRSLQHARRDGWSLEVAPEATRAVRRTIDLAGVTAEFWPASRAEGAGGNP